jgi:GAF domain-containing protein
MQERVVEALGAVREFVAGRQDLDATLLEVSELAVTALGADMAGLTLLGSDGKATTAVSTQPTAVAVDQAQYDADRGPCLEAFREARVHRVDDVRAERRWPEFADAAAAHGVLSSLSLPLVIRGEGIGALNLYSGEPRHFTEDHEAGGAEFASGAAVALASALAYWEQADRAEGLAKAMQSRAVIEQAKGVIIASTGVSPEEAFELLRAQSQSENRKLREIAVEIVEAQRRPRPPDARGQAAAGPDPT